MQNDGAQRDLARPQLCEQLGPRGHQHQSRVSDTLFARYRCVPTRGYLVWSVFTLTCRAGPPSLSKCRPIHSWPGLSALTSAIQRSFHDQWLSLNLPQPAHSLTHPQRDPSSVLRGVSTRVPPMRRPMHRPMPLHSKLHEDERNMLILL